MLIAVDDVGEIHGQIPDTGIQDRAQLRPQSLHGVVIKMTLQVHAGVPATTPHNGDRLLSRVFHGSPSAPTHRWAARVRGSVSHHSAKHDSFDRHKSNEKGRVSACA
jgi:hypothetical protein